MISNDDFFLTENRWVKNQYRLIWRTILLRARAAGFELLSKTFCYIVVQFSH